MSKDPAAQWDIYFRDSWAALSTTLGESQAYRFAASVGLLWVRPDAFAAGVAHVVLDAVVRAGFRPVAGVVVRLDRRGVRALWAGELERATVERLWLLDAVVALGPSVLLLLADDAPVLGSPVASRLRGVKGANDPQVREPGTLRAVAGSPNRALTMVHTAEDGADLVRELGVFCDWPQRCALVAQAAGHLAAGTTWSVEPALRTVQRQVPAMPHVPLAGRVTRHPSGLAAADLADRWAKVRRASEVWPLLAPPGHGCQP
ncbi:nucleoside-diphosphate kinase [Micromonospora sp. CA-263727]|uniref:nucleoside-diphosphate kinase n=1 Tax=Micromonospora sp. CA-263727 TaxID=3239967 RepID=UPI003D8D86DE